MTDLSLKKMFVSSLSNSAAKILVAFILARTSLDANELNEWTGLKRDTIYAGLKLLQDRGMVEKQVLEHGRQLWLPSGDFLPGVFQVSEKRTPEVQMPKKRTPEEELIVVRDLNLIKLDPPTINGQMSEKRTPEESETKSGPTSQEILRHTDMIFDGSFVNSKDLWDCDPLEALAWCAYAFLEFEKRGLDRPAGLVRKRLVDGEPAPGKLRTAWRSILPADFLKAVGLYEPPATSEEAEDDAEVAPKISEQALALKEKIATMLKTAEEKERRRKENA
jgi:hypothetical protein